MRVALDATPLLGPRTGVGRYVAGLARALGALPDGERPDDLRAVAFTARGRRSLPGELPPGFRAVGPPAPARALHRVWSRWELPPVTAFSGRVDVFHATNFVLPPPGAAAGVVTVHDLSFLRTPATVTPAARAYRHLVPRSVERARTVLTPSAAVAEELVDTYRLPADRVRVTPLGVDEDWFATPAPDPALRRALGLPERYFLFAGNLEPRKNLPVLLAAYRAVLASEPDAPALVLVGPPGWGPALDRGGIPDDRLVFLGYRPDAELRAAVAGAVALVYPSSYEGFGLPPLEAFACGVPVIASDLPVVEEVLGPDRALSTRVPVGDVDALTAALLSASATGGADGAGVARRERARAFTWENTAMITLRAYTDAERC
ncbi:glycosyltransferase family 4 protein [Blastococcus litoris]|uniref:glycosyltransferase family 4 protein n=1 Tax=Blastococcus litoris TaxID=2171622 RepID=UPI000E30448F|nr:glycosyltransferase family 1 protein [Blastococcus litoris]